MLYYFEWKVTQSHNKKIVYRNGMMQQLFSCSSIIVLWLQSCILISSWIYVWQKPYSYTCLGFKLDTLEVEVERSEPILLWYMKDDFVLTRGIASEVRIRYVMLIVWKSIVNKKKNIKSFVAAHIIYGIITNMHHGIFVYDCQESKMLIKSK